MAAVLKKQFIAGASCPECQALDKIQLWDFGNQSNQSKEMHCLACGYVEKLSRPDEGSDSRSGDEPVSWR